MYVCNCYPLHIGVTEAGTEEMAVVKSSAALGALLLDGIGDTLRVSKYSFSILPVLAPTRTGILWAFIQSATALILFSPR